MTKHLNIDSKWAAVIVHVTGLIVDCSSKKNGQVMKLTVMPHQKMIFGKCSETIYNNMRDLFDPSENGPHLSSEYSITMSV